MLHIYPAVQNIYKLSESI